MDVGVEQFTWRWRYGLRSPESWAFWRLKFVGYLGRPWPCLLQKVELLRGQSQAISMESDVTDVTWIDGAMTEAGICRSEPQAWTGRCSH